jgi:hypothetical protein
MVLAGTCQLKNKSLPAIIDSADPLNSYLFTCTQKNGNGRVDQSPVDTGILGAETDGIGDGVVLPVARRKRP